MHLKTRILQFLAQAGELLTPEPQLRNDIRYAVTPAPRAAEFDQALRELEDQRFALSVASPLDRTVRWKITDAGRIALAEALPPR